MRDLNAAAAIALFAVVLVGVLEAMLKDPGWILQLVPGLCLLLALRSWRSKR